jgi:AcrR family transcriptional regulator
MAVSHKNVRIPKQQRAMESKENIIIAAMELFAEQGYHKTNALEIAARAEVATGTFYSYFKNKKEVFIEINKRIIRNIAEKVMIDYQLKTHKKRKDNYTEAKNMVHFMIHHIYSEFMTIDIPLIKEILSMTFLDKEISKIRFKEQTDVVNFLIPYMQEYRQYLRITDAKAAAELVLHTVENIIQQIILNNVDVDKKRLLKETEDMICRYLLPVKDF